ncbi:MAG: YqaA family protein, partial [Caulobacteraceae bacterium]
MRLSASRRAPLWLAALAFAEGLFFPIPPDVLLMPLVLAKRDRAWAYAGICLVASVIGGSMGFAVGYYLRPVGAWLIALTGGDAAGFERWYGHWGVFLLAVPIPYKITAIASGMFRLNYLVFLAASIFIRGLRFFLVASL